MKKINKKLVLIGLLILLPVFIIVSFKSYIMAKTMFNYIYSKDYIYSVQYDGTGKLTPVKTQLTDNGTVLLVQRREANDGEVISILNQPNVWCVQHGKNLSFAEYSVSKKYTAKDNILAYILNQRSETNLREKWVDAPNAALWYYLSDTTKSTDKSNILNNIYCKKPSKDENDSLYKNDNSLGTIYDAGKNIYNDAKNYANKLNNFDISIKKCTVNSNNTVTLNVDGEYDAINEIYVNNTKVTPTNISGSGTAKAITIDTSNITTSNITIKVKAKMKIYTAQYRILKSSGIQRLIVSIPGSEEIICEATTSVEQNSDVSLQKYIVQVGTNCAEETNADRKTHTVNGTKYGYVNSRENAKATSTSNIKISATKTANDFIKIVNPVIIQENDYVVYKITIYNNGENDVNCLVRDRIDKNATLIGIYSEHENPVKGTHRYSGEAENLVNYDNNNYGKYYKWKTNVKAGKYNSYWVIVKYEKYVTGKLANKAYINDANASGTYRITDYDYVEFETLDISLQKYIIKVTSDNGTVTYNNETNRKNKMTAEDDPSEDVRNEISKNNTVTDLEYYKRNDPVQIEIGDSVTYRIYVYNNSSVVAQSVLVKDILPYYLDSSGNVVSYVEIQKILKKGSTNDIKPGSENGWQYDTNSDNGISYEITNLAANSETYFDITVKFNGAYSSNILTNNAWIDSTMPENEATYRTADRDYVQMNQYAVSLQKIVSSVNNGSTGSSFDRWDSWESNEINDKQKYNNPVEVANGDKVTYAIKVKNDGSTQVKNIEIKDTLPDGLDISLVRLEKIEGIDGPLSGFNINGKEVTFKIPELDENQTATIYLSTTVTESNMSLNVLRNYAEITGTMQNRNDVEVKDSTPNDNQDADYIQMKDIVISGTVWNDKALDKTQDNYNGYYDSEEGKLSGITVHLYRSGVTDAIATTTTNSNGDYTFSSSDINSGASNERYIKAPKSSDNNRWNSGGYYSYYVVFEYDGITYTSTFDTSGKRIWNISENGEKQYSNAREKLSDESFDGQVNASRTDFNNRFSKINANGAYDNDNNYTTDITYTTKNEDGYIPQSNHVYNASTMEMQSSTNKIELSNDDNLVSQLQHVNLGLRGRDIFDLELTSDVDNIKVTVNNQQGVYKYSNKVTLRKSDLTPSSTTTEDMADKENESSNTYVDRQEQLLRKSDLNVNETGANVTRYDDSQKISDIEVTYKVTIQNASRTAGTATKVTNYYDNRYDLKEVKEGRNCSISNSEAGASGTGFESVIITTTGTTMLNQSETMEIYIVYTLKKPVTTTLTGLTENNPIPTFNMAEITEYKTQCASGQTEYTRGLIDKDSAPGSANEEQVRTTDTVGTNTATTGGNPTTVQYYFGGNDLSKLKYEDDTYATPTLYFVIPEHRDDDGDGKPDNDRIIEGTVFEDNTTTDTTTKIKTGNGKLDSGEVGVYGATVQLYEIVGENKVLRYKTTTGTDGRYTFSGFLPGNYIISYSYGDTKNTILLNQGGTGVNAKSFNGEDYQSTNNTGTHGASTLSSRENFWYLDNESQGISTATDDADRRKEVSNIVADTDNTDEIMEKLYKARAGKSETEISDLGTLINQIKMHADTDKMLFTVEKSYIEDGRVKQRTSFGEYKINNMNFGIAEVPITNIELKKSMIAFTLTDSSGQNIIASLEKDNAGNWVNKTGDVLAIDQNIDISVEDEKLQGAHLQATYAIQADIDIERNFDKSGTPAKTISELVDIIDNDLSYNKELSYELNGTIMKNSDYWEISGGLTTASSSVSDIDKYSTIVKAKDNTINKLNNDDIVTITLEKVLSSTDSTIEQIITSTIDTYEYSNIIEITGINYDNHKTTDPDDGTANDSDPNSPLYPQKDRIRTTEENRGVDGGGTENVEYVLIPGIKHDTAEAEIITIHPPTGDSSINIMYYVIATVSLVILAIGAFGIRKFVVKKNKE